MATGRSQIDASDALYDFTCNPCTKDGKNTEALFQCTDCHVFYCQRCVTGHNKFTENHNVLDKTSKLFGQGQRKPKSVSSSELPPDLCEEHHGEVIKMFCGQHDLVCCTVCIAVKHRLCEDIDYIPNVAKRLLKGRDKDKTKASLEKVKDGLKKIKSEMQNDLKEFNKQRDGILDEIQKFKKRLIARVEELEKKSVKEILDRHREITDDITISSKKIDDLLGDIGKQLDKFKTSNSGNEAQAFVDIKYGEKKITDGNERIREFNARKVKTLEFEVNKSLEQCLLEVQSFGKLTVHVTGGGVGVTQTQPNMMVGGNPMAGTQPGQPAIPGPDQQGANPLQNRNIIWKGQLEWQDKKTVMQGRARITRSLGCMVSIARTDQDINTGSWPSTLIMQLMPQTLLNSQQLHPLFKNRRQVAFHFHNTNLDDLRNLYKVMGSGFTGCVLFPPSTACDIRVLLLKFSMRLFSNKRKSFVGLIPNDQSGVVNGIRQVITQHKQRYSERSKRKVATVEYSYEAEQEDELTIKVGDKILILEQSDDDGWLKGMLGGKIGVFPDNFVTIQEQSDKL